MTGDEMMDELYREGEFVKSLDELGHPKMNENGKLVYRLSSAATVEELLFYQAETRRSPRDTRRPS
jgi:hypothetical protein